MRTLKNLRAKRGGGGGYRNIYYSYTHNMIFTPARRADESVAAVPDGRPDEDELRRLATEPRTAILPQLLTPDDLAGGG